jgi:hypothetical protein
LEGVQDIFFSNIDANGRFWFTRWSELRSSLFESPPRARAVLDILLCPYLYIPPTVGGYNGSLSQERLSLAEREGKVHYRYGKELKWSTRSSLT